MKKIKSNRIYFPVLILYILIVLSDFSVLSLPSINALKLSSIIYCLFIIVCAPGERKRDAAFASTAMAFSVLADYFLVLKNMQPIGMLCFFPTHILHALRFMQKNKKRLAVFLSAALLLLLPIDWLLRIAGVYAVLIITAFISVLHAALTNPGDLRAKRAAIGYLLFLGCDICVALSNLSAFVPGETAVTLRTVAWPLIWFFYLPAQVFLASSAAAAK